MHIDWCRILGHAWEFVRTQYDGYDCFDGGVYYVDEYYCRRCHRWRPLENR